MDSGSRLTPCTFHDEGGATSVRPVARERFFALKTSRVREPGLAAQGRATSSALLDGVGMSRTRGHLERVSSDEVAYAQEQRDRTGGVRQGLSAPAMTRGVAQDRYSLIDSIANTSSTVISRSNARQIPLGSLPVLLAAGRDEPNQLRSRPTGTIDIEPGVPRGVGRSGVAEVEQRLRAVQAIVRLVVE